MAVLFTFTAALFAAFLLPTALQGEIIHHQVTWISALDIKAGILADPLSIFMANIVIWISFLIMVYSVGYMHGDKNLTRYWFFMNFFIGNMLLIVLSDNFLQLFFGWEGVGLCSYGLIGFWNKDELKDYVGTPGHTVWRLPQAYSPSHAGMKAFIMTRIGDVSFLIGLLTLYFYTGTFNFVELTEKTGWGKELAAAGLLIPVAVLIFGGAVGKSAQFPLHEWLPDAMAGPTAVSALIHAATMVKAGVFLVARVGPIFYNAALTAEEIVPLFVTIAVIGGFTAFLAATQATVAGEVKKVLAYSTVSQIGYMMLALGVAGLANDFVAGYTAGFFHLTSHAIFKAALFMGAGSLIHATGSKYLKDMGGLRKNMRYTYVSMTIVAGSLAGIPFLSGFWSKDAILAAILHAENSVAMPLFILAVITALMTAFYSFRMIGLAFFGEASKHLEDREKKGEHVHEVPKVMWIPYSILAAATLLIGIVGFFFEESLHHIFGHIIEHEFVNIHVAEAGVGINPIALASSLLAVGIGGYLAYYYYIGRRSNPAHIVEGNDLIRGVHRFFVNRWYINALYYRIFVNSTLALSGFIYRHFERPMDKLLNEIVPKQFISIREPVIRYLERPMDKLLNEIVPKLAVSLSDIGRKFDEYVIDGIVNRIAVVSKFVSGVARRIQTGVIEEYIFVYIAGVVLLVLLFIYILVIGIGG